MPATQVYEYDQLGRRIAVTGELGSISRSKLFYDAQGRIVKTVNAAGIVTTTTYVWSATVLGVGGKAVGGWIRTTANAAGTAAQRSSVDHVEYFGRNVYHYDLGNHAFTYSYDFAGRLKRQTGSTGQDIRYDYYANGYLKSIADHALGVVSSYGYDLDGNRTNESYRSIQTAARPVVEVYQSARVEYDALNRVKSVASTGGSFNADLRYEYDAVGNVRHIRADYKDGDNGNVRVQDLWYDYDRMNRFVVTQGTLKLTGITDRNQLTSAADTRGRVERGANGVAIEYDAAGRRRAATYGDGTAGTQQVGQQSYLGYSNDGHRETYDYTADGYLETVKIGGVTRATRKNDAAGRVTEYVQYNADASWLDTRTTTYLADNRANVVTYEKGTGNARTRSTTTQNYLADGTLDKTVQRNWSWGSGSQTEGATVTTLYRYQWWDGAKQTEIKIQGAAPNLSDDWAPGFSEFQYDINGHTKAVIDNIGIGSGKRELVYLTDAQGQVLRRDEDVSSQLHRWRQYYYLNGERIGDVSNDGPSREDYAQAIAAQQDTRNKDERYSQWKPIYSADFDQNYEPITPDYPGTVAGSYVVRQGDTLPAIAAALWGDAQMWYLIAEANGLTGSEPLTEGQSLVIPNKVTNIHHNAQTRRVYNAGEALGDVAPTLPEAPPPKSDDCGGIGTIIMIAIAVVVTAYTGGAAAEHSAAFGGRGFWGAPSPATRSAAPRGRWPARASPWRPACRTASTGRRWGSRP